MVQKKSLEGMPLSEEDEGPGGNATVREEGPGGDDTGTEEEPVGISLTQEHQGVNNSHTQDGTRMTYLALWTPYICVYQCQRFHTSSCKKKCYGQSHIITLTRPLGLATLAISPSMSVFSCSHTLL